MSTQTKTQHTPGPWRNEYCGGRNEVVTSPIDGHPLKLEVARVHNDANAALIAAAPDLLAACEAAEHIVADWMRIKSEEYGGPGWIKDDNALTQVRAAIAKARGQS